MAPIPGADQEDEVGDEMRVVKRGRNPSEPTAQERQDHEDQGHVQHRSWCKICNAARGLGQQHRQGEPEDPEMEVLKISIDYGYMADKTDAEAETLPFLAVREKKSKSYGGTFVDRKGPSAYSVKYLVGWVRHQGIGRAIFQCDGEPALVALRDEVA